MWRVAQVARRSLHTLNSRLGRHGETIVQARTLSIATTTKTSGEARFAQRNVTRCARRWTSRLASASRPEKPVDGSLTPSSFRHLPLVCPGCGALSQTVEPDIPGFYNPETKRNKRQGSRSHEDQVFQEAMARLTGTEHEPAHVEFSKNSAEEVDSKSVPICDRCHYLLYQSKGAPIVHPSMHSIQSIIESSPHKHNHIYHVLDAADFPMSLIPNLMNALELPRLRTQNRRSKSARYSRGRLAEVSFIITRSDLLAPMKEQVDRLMPYLQEVLREALGRTGRNVRLGNVRLVSAKRGWWTTAVKQEIWNRGGAGWFVGKVNVGKSALFEVVFPKGRSDTAETENLLKARRAANQSAQKDGVSHEHEIQGSDVLSQLEDLGHDNNSSVADAAHNLEAEDDDALSQFDSLHDVNLPSRETRGVTSSQAEDVAELDGVVDASSSWEDREFDEDEDASLLPPARPEVRYPQMPTVSSLPGTTASPIRIPFGGGKGELIDLPGVERSLLETHVLPQHRSSLIMSHRIVPEQMSMRPGQSLLVGGMIRITPVTDDVQFLAYSFTPLKAHPTSTLKAVAIQTGINEDGTPYDGSVESIATDASKKSMRSAGRFKLEWNVTKQRTGSLTSKEAGKQKVDSLPFTVYSADILIEGVGWVELTCQVRKYKRRTLSHDFMPLDGNSGEFELNLEKPEVEIFSPEGKFIGLRRPMNAWLLGGPKKVAKHARKSRPRMTISMKKRQEGGRLGRQRVDVAAA